MPPAVSPTTGVFGRDAPCRPADYSQNATPTFDGLGRYAKVPTNIGIGELKVHEYGQGRAVDRPETETTVKLRSQSRPVFRENACAGHLGAVFFDKDHRTAQLPFRRMPGQAPRRAFAELARRPLEPRHVAAVRLLQCRQWSAATIGRRDLPLPDNPERPR